MENCPHQKFIQDICTKTFNRLEKMYLEPEKSKLIFPEYADKNIRISEQEARFSFVNELEKSNHYYYSIETPTEHKYKDFTTLQPKIFERVANDGRSGEIDLTVYEISKENRETNEKPQFKRIINIEFKKGQPEQSAINKDLLKLYFEEPCGMWFHIIQHTDSGTLKAICDKLNEGLKYVRNPNISTISVINRKIIFFIAILEQEPNKNCRYLNCIIDVTKEEIKLVDKGMIEPKII